MNRKQLKSVARQRLSETGQGTGKVTLIFLVASVVLLVLRYFLLEAIGRMDMGGNYISNAVSSEAKQMALTYVVSFAMQILIVVFCTGYTATALEMKNQNPVGHGSLLAGFRMAPRVILAYVLMELLIGLIATVCSIPLVYVLSMAIQLQPDMIGASGVMTVIMIYVGVVMFIVSYRYRTLFFGIMDHPGMSVRQALRQANAITRGHRWQLFLLDLSFLPWILLSILTCGILLIWKLPYIMTTYALAYEFLMEDYRQRQEHFRQLREQMMQNRMQ